MKDTEVRWLERKFQTIFFRVGKFVGTYPKTFLFTSIAVSLALGAVPLIKKTQFNRDSDSWYPSNAPAWREREIVKEFFSERGKLFWLSVVLRAHDGSNLLLDENRWLVQDAHYYIMSVLKLPGTTEVFSDYCGHYCDTNNKIHSFFTAYETQNTKSEFSYPSAVLLGEPVYMGDSFYDVTTDENRTIDYVGAVNLEFKAVSDNSTVTALLDKWSLAVLEVVRTQRQSVIFKNLSIAALSHMIMSEEVTVAGTGAAPYFGYSFLALTIFAVVTCLRKDHAKSKPWEAVAGVFCPILALMASFGFLILLDLPFHSMNTVIPFLVIAIGIDDAFMLLHTWHNSKSSCSVPERLGFTLQHTGSAITLTSVTNSVSFALGTISLTPTIRDFCIYTSVSVAVNFVFQIAFFLAVVAIGGAREAKLKEACCGWSTLTQKAQLTNKPILTCIDVRFLENYSKLICKVPVKAMLFCLLIGYWAVSIYGLVKLEVTNVPKNLVLRTSPLIPYYDFQQNIMWKQGLKISFFVNKVPDFEINTNAELFKAFIDEVESMQKAVGRESTTLWFRNFLSFLVSIGYYNDVETSSSSFERQAFVNDELPAFLPGVYRYVNYDPVTYEISSFTFNTAFQDIHGWPEYAQLLLDCRALCEKYSHHFNVSIFHRQEFYADFMLSLRPFVIFSVLLAFASMFLACLVFIPNKISLLPSMLALASITIGVFGFFSLCDVFLDPIASICFLMAVGLSVDFVSHVCYHYFVNLDEPIGYKRVEKTLQAVAWPLLQAGLSTGLSICMLAFNNAYMTDVFVKTIVFVVVLGLIHGLLFLPAFLDFGSMVVVWPRFVAESVSVLYHRRKHHDLPNENTVANEKEKRKSNEEIIENKTKRIKDGNPSTGENQPDRAAHEEKKNADGAMTNSIKQENGETDLGEDETETYKNYKNPCRIEKGNQHGEKLSIY